jgi:hypothetical protein
MVGANLDSLSASCTVLQASGNPACQPKSLMKKLKLTLVLTSTFYRKDKYPKFEPVTPPKNYA